MNTVLSSEQNLEQLAVDINREHRAAESAARSAIEHALAAGRLLVEAKGQVGHGGWLEWLKENTEVSPRQSQRYMKLANNWPAIEGKYDAASHLTIDGALRLLDGKPGKTRRAGIYELPFGFTWNREGDHIEIHTPSGVVKFSLTGATFPDGMTREEWENVGYVLANFGKALLTQLFIAA